jgi:HD-GYP domain-containing protein (c-di-GMP phosphodiesterase class II)
LLSKGQKNARSRRRKYRGSLEELANDRTAQVRDANERFEREIVECRAAQQVLVASRDQLMRVHIATVNALADVGELLGLYASGHPRRVAKVAVAIASNLGASSETVEGIHVMGLLHDVDKIALPMPSLRKAMPLTREGNPGHQAPSPGRLRYGAGNTLFNAGCNCHTTASRAPRRNGLSFRGERHGPYF